jgi:hypothetical protein
MRTGTRFRVPLEGEGRHVGAGDALQGAVEQRHVGGTQVFRQGIGVDRKTVVLAGDQHLAGIHVFHGVIGTVVAELHLQRPGARSQGQQLVAEADAEGRDATVEEFADGDDRVVAGLRIAGAV